IGGDGQDHLFGEGGNDILLGDLGTISNHVLENGTPIDHRLNVNQDSLKMIGTIYGDHDREEIEGEENKRTLIDTDIDFLDSFGVEPNAYISKVIYNM
ncbi:MAG: hypothetical protein GWN14_02205, partial [candidate division Zixibacteria bacterium]|nr:hypothetical protein [Gammaproteobacteria bacterium]NIX54769.1 hypothetical protein [candidate division Zixibacteria bacterium]